jgi:hypothetical protein
MATQDVQMMSVPQDDQVKILTDIKSLMERQLVVSEGIQKNMVQLASGQARLHGSLGCLRESFGDLKLQQQLQGGSQMTKMTESFSELQNIQMNSANMSRRLDCMELRQCYNSSEHKDSLRGLGQYAKGDSWTLSKAQAKGVQNALEQGLTSYGDIVVSCDRRRAEYQVVEGHIEAALPRGELWRTGCVALRMPTIQAALIAHGVPEVLLRQFVPGADLLEHLRDGPVMANTQGEAMTQNDIQHFERETLFNQRTSDQADGWASVSQISTGAVENQNMQPDGEMEQSSQGIPDSQA